MDDEDSMEDVEEGPEMPPEEDEEAEPEDDEGRFFGGGITKNTTAVLDFIDNQDQDGSVSLTNRLG